MIQVGTHAEQVVTQVQRWLREVVIGLQLCPFAARPVRDDNVRFAVSDAIDAQGLLRDLEAELQKIESAKPSVVETTLLIAPSALADFYAFNDLLGDCDELLRSSGREGVFQIASFHPRYRFADTAQDDAENLTNRAPFPIVHILREASVAVALEQHEDSEEIWRRNVRTMRTMDARRRRALFPYLEDDAVDESSGGPLD